jgi:hypothetical protein
MVVFVWSFAHINVWGYSKVARFGERKKKRRDIEYRHDWVFFILFYFYFCVGCFSFQSKFEEMTSIGKLFYTVTKLF